MSPKNIIKPTACPYSRELINSFKPIPMVEYTTYKAVIVLTIVKTAGVANV